jgi:murein DD-endopeptidase MepM/ murein hydrolase activator NlpD
MIRFISIALLCCSFQGLSQEQSLKIYTEQTKTSVFVYADNDKPYPQSAKVNFELKGLKHREPLPDFVVIPANTTQFEVTELVIPERRSWTYQYGSVYIMGDASAEHNDDIVYALPFKEGKQFKVEQGYNGKSSHAGENALDFNLPAGEPIMAARDGKVVMLKSDSNRGCPDSSCARLGNFITIMHDDGSFADYYHLKQNGVLVAIGDEVTAGQAIGLTGNTGWATGYHLHFIVYVQRFDGRKTLKTRFKTSKDPAALLKEGEVYEATRLR